METARYCKLCKAYGSRVKVPRGATKQNAETIRGRKYQVGMKSRKCKYIFEICILNSFILCRYSASLYHGLHIAMVPRLHQSIATVILLVPELQSEMRSGYGTQLFEKTQCFYVATVNFNVSVYYHVM